VNTYVGLPYLLEDELKKMGAHYHRNYFSFTHRVEVDGNIITGQNSQSTTVVFYEIEKILENRK